MGHSVIPPFVTRAFAICLALIALAGQAPARTDLAKALAAAAPGDVIALAPGPHAGLVLDAGQYFEPPVTIRSADPANPAILGRLMVRDGGGLIFEDLLFDYEAAPGDGDKTQAVSIQGARDIVLRRNVFDGDLAREGPDWAIGKPMAHGLTLRGVQSIRLEDNEWRRWARAVIVDHSRDVIIRGNSIHAIRSDGIDFAQVTRVLVEANHFYAFDGASDSPDHRDMIQFWTASTNRPTREVTIRGNLFDAAGGAATQSIFIRNELAERQPERREEMLYRDIVITGNLIRNGHLHGITISNARGVTISDNTLLRMVGSPSPGALGTPRINLFGGTEEASVTGNLVSEVIQSKDTLLIRQDNNVAIRPDGQPGPGRYDALFADPYGEADQSGWQHPVTRAGGLPASATPVLRALSAVSPGAADSAGSPLSRLPGIGRGRIEAVPTDPGTPGAWALRVVIEDETGRQAPMPLTTAVDWFVNGQPLGRNGPQVGIKTKNSGLMRVTAAVAGSGGPFLGRTILLPDPVMLDVDFLMPPQALADRLKGRLQPAGGLFLRKESGGAVPLGRPFQRRGAESFTMLLTLSNLTPENFGIIATLPGALILSVGPRGPKADIVLAGGHKVSVRTTRPPSLDSGDLNLTLLFDGRSGHAHIYVGDQLLGESRFPKGSLLNPRPSNDLLLGHPSKPPFGGLIRHLLLAEPPLAPGQLRDLLKTRK